MIKTIAKGNNYISHLTDYAVKYYSTIIEGNIVPIHLADLPWNIFVVAFYPENSIYQNLVEAVMELITEAFATL